MLPSVTPPTSPAKNTPQCFCNSWFGALDRHQRLWRQQNMELQRKLYPNQLCSRQTSLTGACWASGQNSWTQQCHSSYQIPDILSPPFISLHTPLCVTPNPVTITHSDCTLHSMIGSSCCTVYLEQFVFNILLVQVMGWLPSNCFWIAVEQVSWKESH